MFTEKVPAEISVKVTPGRVDMVGSVLRVSILKQEGGALYPVVVRLKSLGASGPGKSNFV